MEGDEEGWKQAVHNPDQLIARWLQGGSYADGPTRPVEDLQHGKLFDMIHAERKLLHRDWLRGIRDPLIRGLVDAERGFAETKAKLDRVRKDVDLRCLQQARIVGSQQRGRRGTLTFCVG